MHISEFDFDLPHELIAQYPPHTRGDSRLLCVPPDAHLAAEPCWIDAQFSEFPKYLQAGDVLVMNNTRVLKARLFGKKSSGGRIEALIERVLNAQEALAHIRASKSPKEGTRLDFHGGVQAEMLGREGELFHLRFDSSQSVYEILEKIGHLPLPPYIERAAAAHDEERYQTVFAQHAGAVAAPTAGLHFTESMLSNLTAAGIRLAWVTLHVGAGTFQPVRVEQIHEHRMHSEYFNIPPETVNAIETAHNCGGRVVAVGTTSLRALESAARHGQLLAGASETDIFITPGFKFRVVDALLTNFHLPKSTLLMLVAAFSGLSTIRAAYQHAITQRYRFFSYGDAMFLQRAS